MTTSARAHRGRSRSIRLGAAALLLAGLLASPLPASAADFTFQVVVGTECVDGVGPAGSVHVIRLFTAQGDLRATVMTHSDVDGTWTACFGDHAIFPGNKIRASSGSLARTWRVPAITMNVVRASDFVRGRAPANSTFTVTLVHIEGYTDEVSFPRTITAGPNGAWSTDFTSDVNMRGADTVRLVHELDGDRTTILSVVPFMAVFRANNRVEGWLVPGQAATIFLVDPDGHLRGRAFVSGSVALGRFEGFLHTPGGSGAFPRVGDRITGDFSRDATFKIPNVVIVGDAATNIVSGFCMPDRPFQVRARGAGGGSALVTGISGPDASFAADVGPQLDLQPGDRVEVLCKFVSGDQVGRSSLAN
jgi:hypothetical protein